MSRDAVLLLKGSVAVEYSNFKMASAQGNLRHNGSMTKSRQIIENHFQRGDFTGWFDAVYANASGDASAVPWARMTPNHDLVAWLDQNHPYGDGKRAIVVGCGLGDDAEELARRHFSVTAFDISEQAIAWCKRRFPTSKVDYQAADLFNLPMDWKTQFDLVLESWTLQSLPWQLNKAAVQAIGSLVAAEGILIVLCMGREPDEENRGIPWAQSRDELDEFLKCGLQESTFDDLRDRTGVRHFRIVYRAVRHANPKEPSGS